MVITGFVLYCRVPMMVKMYCLALSGCIYLSSGGGDDTLTTYDGSFLSPHWLRITTSRAPRCSMLGSGLAWSSSSSSMCFGSEGLRSVGGLQVSLG